MDESLINQIKKDLEKSGFGSEMRAIKSFLDRNWYECTGNFSFFDKDNNITREGDFCASHQHFKKYENKKHVECWYYIVGEVKKSEKPWVVFKEYFAKKRTWKSQEGWRNITFSQDLPCHPKHFAKAISSHSLRSELNWVGYGIHESFKNPDQPSRWYPSLVSCCKAAEHTLNVQTWEVEEENNVSTSLENDNTFFVFVKPTIILDAPLFSSVINDNGEIIVEKIDYAPIEFNFKTNNYDRETYFVDIVTLTGLDKYIEISEKKHKFIFNALVKKREEMLKT